jgi:WD40 repeat protein
MLVASFALRAAVTSVSIDRSGRHVVAASEDGAVEVWALDGSKAFAYVHAATPHHAVLTPDGARLALAAEDETSMWDVATRRRIVELASSRAGSIVSDPAGARWLSAHRDGHARIWDVGSGRLVRDLEHGAGGVYDATWSNDGTLVATCGGDAVKLWAAGREPRTLRVPGTCVSIAFDDRGERIAAATNGSTTITIWNARTGDPEPALETQDPIFQVAFLRSDLVVAAGTETLTVWDRSAHQLLDVLFRGPNQAFDVSASTGLVAIGSGNHVHVFRLPVDPTPALDDILGRFPAAR